MLEFAICSLRKIREYILKIYSTGQCNEGVVCRVYFKFHQGYNYKMLDGLASDV